MAAKYPYYLLADSPEGIKKEAELTGQDRPRRYQTDNDIRKGFVYKRVPHVTLKSIANNPDIKEGMTRAADRRRHRPARRHRNALRPALRRQQAHPRQRPIHRRESLSPHRTISDRREKIESRGRPRRPKLKVIGPDNFGHDDPGQPPQGRRAEHAQGRAAEVRPLEPYAGEWIHGDGRHTPTTEGKAPKRRAPSASARSTAPSAPAHQEGGQGGGQGRGFRRAVGLRFCLRPQRVAKRPSATAS